MDAPLPRDLKEQLLRFQAGSVYMHHCTPQHRALQPADPACGILPLQSALRNLEVALEPVLKLTGQELDHQARFAALHLDALHPYSASEM